MSYLNTKQALITQLINNLPTGLNSSDVAFENKAFDPAKKELWLAAYFIPVTSETKGKDFNDEDEQRGIFQISVFSSLNNEEFDSTQLEAIDQLVSAFRFNTELTYLTQTVYTEDTNVTSGTESESWFQRDISINYLTISER